MPSNRKLASAILTVSMALALVAIPLRVTIKGWHVELSWRSAVAKDSNGKGGGSGKDKGNGQGQGNGKSGGDGKGSSGKSAGKNAATDSGRHVSPSSGDIVQISGSSIDVLHRNGMREGIKAGRYSMKDEKGRTIIERRATNADVQRLRGMVD
jgi:hypothetical protein